VFKVGRSPWTCCLYSLHWYAKDSTNPEWAKREIQNKDYSTKISSFLIVKSNTAVFITCRKCFFFGHEQTAILQYSWSTTAVLVQYNWSSTTIILQYYNTAIQLQYHCTLNTTIILQHNCSAIHNTTKVQYYWSEILTKCSTIPLKYNQNKFYFHKSWIKVKTTVNFSNCNATQNVILLSFFLLHITGWVSDNVSVYLFTNHAHILNHI